jgi:poly(A) polymerase
LNDTDSQSRPVPTIIPRKEHNISRADISDNALKVLYRLKKAGYAGFLVGGSVRDLLLGLHPKDFDVATDAHPEDVKRLFRNSRLIGRRFRLAHVRFGREIIEVATFRSAGEGNDIDREHHAESGRILRDNVYGTIGEDIWRRDFTVNALYYNIADYSIWDYTTGLEDVRHHTLRLIGDPLQRYREDPVRMLRAVRLAAKLDFSIAPDTAKPIGELAPLLADVPAARLFDEVLKLFQTGHALRSFELLERNGLLGYLFRATNELLASTDGDRIRTFIRRGLENTDARVRHDQPVTPMFLYAIMLWPVIRRLADNLLSRGDRTEYQAMHEAIARSIAEQQSHTSLPKRFSVPMREILQMQGRFAQRRGTRAARFLEHKRFRAAYDFLLLRAECGEVEPEVAEWWTKVQEQAPTERHQSMGIKRRKHSARRGRRKRRKRTSAERARD